jgi:DNA uptake protein ComE-like DNA-binding protein
VPPTPATRSRWPWLSLLPLGLGAWAPILAGASHAGLVDVNGAPVAVLTRLPGVDDALAAEIDRVRIAVDGFSSLEDLGMTLELDGGLVEDLRGRVVFLPR